MNSAHADNDHGRVIRLRPRIGGRPASPWRSPPVDDPTRYDSPVPDLAKYECPESDDEYRHRMMLNAIAFVFTSLLVLAGVWIATHMVVHA
ncbi:MAG TPA: hypothetical protein VFQ33_03270 [Xanthobacteraceae bacterium]|nr:hypothetical protein [Xanthobacteraceae bacterium]